MAIDQAHAPGPLPRMKGGGIATADDVRKHRADQERFSRNAESRRAVTRKAERRQGRLAAAGAAATIVAAILIGGFLGGCQDPATTALPEGVDAVTGDSLVLVTPGGGG